MIASLAIAFLTAPVLPANLTSDMLGMPILRSDSVKILSHSATFQVERDAVTVESTTLYQNATNSVLKTEVGIPQLSYGKTGTRGLIPVTGQWDNKALKLTSANPWLDLESLKRGPSVVRFSHAEVSFVPNGKASLKLRYKVPVGRVGYESKERAVGYLLHETKPIETLNLSYKYTQRVVFNLPEMMSPPNWGWQIGLQGAYIRRTGFVPRYDSVLMHYYASDFQQRFDEP